MISFAFCTAKVPGEVTVITSGRNRGSNAAPGGESKLAIAPPRRLADDARHHGALSQD
ncbi:hypothetical protein [Inquilinus sp.]|uniref:hypothetical protein n=1 Tax=Inquilinus sp. TaxID=1932117 RepID=UPI0031D60CB0